MTSQQEQIKLTEVIAPSFYDLHRDVAAGGHTYYKLDGGRGSAKSSFVGTEIVLGMMRDAKAGKLTNAVAFRRYKENLHDSVFEQLLWSINKLGVAHLWKETVSPLRLTYIPTGQVILFRGADKVKKAKSIKVSKAPTLPPRSKRLFRELAIDQGQGGDLYKVFNPEIRDTSLFNGLDKILKRIEFNCNLAYGTLSDPQNVDKTAEEIRSSKQRSYSAVCDVQQALQDALEHLVWAMDFYATLYKLAPRGEYEVNFTWGDGILQDTDKEYMRRKEMADNGYLRPEKFVAWYFGISEEEAKDYMPEAAPPLFGEE